MKNVYEGDQLLMNLQDDGVGLHGELRSRKLHMFCYFSN